jgi:hypothetical protein
MWGSDHRALGSDPTDAFDAAPRRYSFHVISTPPVCSTFTDSAGLSSDQIVRDARLELLQGRIRIGQFERAPDGPSPA